MNYYFFEKIIFFSVAEMADQDFIASILKRLHQIKTVDGEKWNKYDIDNGILSYYQNNDNLSEEKYNFLSNVREKMWMNDNRTISYDKFEFILNNNFNILFDLNEEQKIFANLIDNNNFNINIYPGFGITMITLWLIYNNIKYNDYVPKNIIIVCHTMYDVRAYKQNIEKFLTFDINVILDRKFNTEKEYDMVILYKSNKNRIINSKKLIKIVNENGIYPLLNFNEYNIVKYINKLLSKFEKDENIYTEIENIKDLYLETKELYLNGLIQEYQKSYENFRACERKSIRKLLEIKECN